MAASGWKKRTGMFGLLPRFKIAHKLLASSALIVLPVVLLLVPLIAGYNRTIASTRQEIDGLRRLQPLQRLVESARDYARLDGLRLRGDLGRESQRTEAARRVDESLAEFERLSGPDGAAAAGQARTRWQQIRSSAPVSGTQVAAAHQELVTEVEDLIRAAGDSSGLMLDADMDVFSLVEMTVVLLPQAQATAAEAIHVADGLVLGTQIAPRDLGRLAVYSEILEKTMLPQVRRAAETSIRSDGDFHGTSRSLQQNLPVALSQYQVRLSAAADAMRRFSQAPEASQTAAQVLESVEGVGQAGSELWQTGLTELGLLLETRLTDLSWSRTEVLSLVMLGLLILVTIVTERARNITAPLEELVRLAEEISAGRIQAARERLQGGLTREMAAAEGARDEICLLVRAVARMTENLDSLLMQVGSAGRQVAGSAVRIASAARQLEATITEQAAATTQVSATSKQISSTVQELARTMADVSQVALAAAATAGEGVSSLDQIHASMRSLAAAGEGLSAALGTVAEKARRVDEVIAAITKIANRTNLLSLNAAIEAEKAGSAGGFPVVALEVRRLADQTAVAALDIEQLVQEMQGAVGEGVARVELYAGQARASSSAMEALSTGLGRIISDARTLGPQFEDVNQGMQLQAKGAGQISESMGQLRDAAQQTRESLADFRTVAERLRETVEGLQAELGKFSAAGA